MGQTPGIEPEAARSRPYDDDEACLSCGRPYQIGTGWGGECLECAVLRQEHRDGEHGSGSRSDCASCA